MHLDWSWMAPATTHVERTGPYFHTVLVRQYRGSEVIEVRRIVPASAPPRQRIRMAAAWLWRRWLEFEPVRRFCQWREWRAIQNGEPINWPDRIRPFEKK